MELAFINPCLRTAEPIWELLSLFKVVRVAVGFPGPLATELSQLRKTLDLFTGQVGRIDGNSHGVIRVSALVFSSGGCRWSPAGFFQGRSPSNFFPAPSQVQKNGDQETLLHELNKKKTAWRIGGEADHLLSRGF
jgi:hypothetical protein